MSTVLREFARKAREKFDANIGIHPRLAPFGDADRSRVRGAIPDRWSYERQLLYCKLDDAALAEVVRHSIANSSHHEVVDENSLHLHDGTYDSIVLQVLAPLMLRRIEEMHREIEACSEVITDCDADVHEIRGRLRAAIGIVEVNG